MNETKPTATQTAASQAATTAAQPASPGVQTSDAQAADANSGNGGRFGRWLLRLRERYGLRGRQGYIFVVAALIGVATGVAAGLLKLMIGTTASLVEGKWSLPLLPWIMLPIPVVGIILTGLYVRKVVKMPIEHGVRRISRMLDSGHWHMPGRLMYSWMVAATVTLGFGGSAGGEGPTASTGAAIGSNMGRWARLDPATIRMLIACGAGAGIAGIFKAPIGGVIFVLEVLRAEMDTMSVVALITSCLISSLTAYILSGMTVDLSYVQQTPFEPQMFLWLVGLGVVCGLYSAYYSRIMKIMEGAYTSIRGAFVRNLVSGLVLTAILFCFPSMFGEGYNVMGHLINGDTTVVAHGSLLARAFHGAWMPVVVALAIALLKCFACSATNCGGGVAGDFAPTLFAGCFLGFAYAQAMQMLFGAHIPVSGFAFVAMAGVMAGVCRAPFMSIFLVAEMCNGFNLLLPIFITAAISFGIVRIFSPAAPYAVKG